MKILAHTLQLLYPADTGSQIRSSQTFKHLSRLHDVTLVTFRRPEDTAEQVEQTRAACSRLILIDKKETPKFYLELAANMLSRYPYILKKYYDPRMVRKIRELVEEDDFDIFVCECLQPSLNVLSLPFRPKVLSQHNVESIIRKRHY